MPPESPVTLALLAGGRGSRMGRPKSHLTLANRPILAHLHDQFAWPGPTLLVTAPGNECPPARDLFDAETTDPVADEGPLRGVLTALEHAATPIVAVVTVDMPAVTAEQVRWLVERLSEWAVMSARWIDGVERIEPFPSAFRVATAKDLIARRLARGERSVYALRDEAGVNVERAPADWPARVWTNLNHLNQLHAFERELRR